MNKGLKWEKKGKIFNPSGQREWMDSYAQNPNSLELEDRVRIYFTCRPKKSDNGKFVSYTGYADFEKEEPFRLIEIAEEPVLELGGIGDFDEFGIMPGSILRVHEKNEVWLYYVGWTRMVSVPYKWSVGLAISKDGGKTFKRYSKGPILPSTFFDPYLQACPRVYRLNDGQWKMYYQSGTEWNVAEGKPESVYITRQARSENGINWITEDQQVIPSIVEKECQTSACVFERGNKHHMYFSFRHGIGFRSKEKGYRIGYMHSIDGENWEREDENSGINVSDKGWDSEMVCYPDIMELRGEFFMFYCGNYFGRDGFGYAKLIED